MARTNNLTNFLNDVATAIKTKLGDSTAIPAAQFDSKIMDIETPGVYQDKQMEITVNGTYTVYPDVGYDALSSIRLTVDVSGTEPMEPTTATVDDVISPETFYSNGQKLTGAIIPTYDGNTFYPDKTMTNDFLVQSANFELGIGIRIDSGGLRFGKLVDNHWSTVKTFTTTELGTGTLAIYRAILFPYKDSDTTIKILITSSTSISGGFNIYGRIYELDFRNIDNPTITLLTTSGVLSSNSYERNNGRAGQIKLVWLTNSTCMLVQAYAPGVGYNSRSFYFRSLKINISDDNTMTVTNSRTRTLATDVYGDDWGGTPAGVATAYRSGNYVISVANKNYRGGNSGQWYYITIITDWVNNVDYQITNTSDIGYIVENGLVYGNNKICRVTSPTTTLYTTTINGLGSRFNYSVNGYAFMGTSSALQIYKLETERVLLLDTYDSYGDTHLSEDGGVIYSWNPTNWTSLKTFILEQKLVSFIRKNVIYSDTSKSTATINNVLNGKTFYNSSGLQIGAMPNRGAVQYTPSTSQQSIDNGYHNGSIIKAVTSDIDINIIPENIRNGVIILGIEGNYQGSQGGDATSDANLQAKYLLEGYSMVADGQLIAGTMHDYGNYTITATSNDITIPEGHYNSLSIPIINAANCTDYSACNAAILSI